MSKSLLIIDKNNYFCQRTWRKNIRLTWETYADPPQSRFTHEMSGELPYIGVGDAIKQYCFSCKCAITYFFYIIGANGNTHHMVSIIYILFRRLPILWDSNHYLGVYFQPVYCEIDL